MCLPISPIRCKPGQDNEYADLFWASCGGGGGNFAFVTELTFRPVQVCQWKEKTDDCTVLKLYIEVPATPENVMFYQEWSVGVSTRITVSCTRMALNSG